MVCILVSQMVFVIQAGSKAQGDRRAGMLGVVMENSVPVALPAASRQEAAVLGVLVCVFGATMCSPNLLL